MIVGFNIDSLNAEKDGNTKRNLQINYRPEITDVEAVSVSAFEEEVSKISFDFTVSYEANGSEAAEISMSGSLLWKGNLEELEEAWEEDETLPDNLRAHLMNELYRRLLSEAVGVANTLGLLPPIPTPKVKN